MAPDDLSQPSASARSSILPRSIARAIVEMRRAMAGPLTAADLTVLTGVPQRTLRRHFMTFVGHGPLEHYRQMRLAAVREALLAYGGDGASVTEVAAAFGFMHLGRFSSAYRIRFGERPSATVARARAATQPPITGRAPTIEPRLLTGSATEDVAPLSLPSGWRLVPALAVLPFRTATGLMEDRAFAEGLAEHLAAALARTRDVAIHVARPAVAGAATSARAVGARYGLTGHLSRPRERCLRIILRLVDQAAADRTLWGDAFDGGADDLLALEDRIVAAVLRAIRPGIEAAETERAQRRPVQDLTARDLVLRAFPILLANDRTSLRDALGPLEQAIELDPDDPVPVALLAYCRMALVNQCAAPDPEAEAARAGQLADRAAALDPVGNAWVLTARGAVATLARRSEEADALLSRARAVDPQFAWAWQRSGCLDARSSIRAEAALRAFRRALWLRIPKAATPTCLAGIGTAHFQIQQYDPAVRAVERAYARNPMATWMNVLLVGGHIGRGDRGAARAPLERLRRGCPYTTAGRLIGWLPQDRDGLPPALLARLPDELAALGLRD